MMTMMMYINKFDIRGYIPSSLIDWDNHICAMILLPGCNFDCPYCHSGQIAHDYDKLDKIDIDYIVGDINKNKRFVDSLCISGGEPTIHSWLFGLCHWLKIKTNLPIKLNTNGSNSSILKTLANSKLVDLFSMDIKATFDRYNYIIGFNNVDAIKESISFFISSTYDYEFKMTMYPPSFLYGIGYASNFLDLLNTIYGAKRIVIQQFYPGFSYRKSVSGIEPFGIGILNDYAEWINKISKPKEPCVIKL